MINIYLDDERKAPPNYLRVYTAQECINELMRSNCDTLSLDHDLGEDDVGTGYDVLLWLEEKAATNKEFKLPNKILVHSANASAREKMVAAIKSIERFRNNKQI